MFSSPISAASPASFKQGRQKLQPAGEAAGTDVLQTQGAAESRVLVPLGVSGSTALAPGAGEKGACRSTSHCIAPKGLSQRKEAFQRQGLHRPGADAGQQDPLHVLWFLRDAVPGNSRDFKHLIPELC